MGEVRASDEGKGRGALLLPPLPPPRSRGGGRGGLAPWLGQKSAKAAGGGPAPAGGFRVFAAAEICELRDL